MEADQSDSIVQPHVQQTIIGVFPHPNLSVLGNNTLESETLESSEIFPGLSETEDDRLTMSTDQYLTGT